jgi:tungstate transport system ATP-binding protein
MTGQVVLEARGLSVTAGARTILDVPTLRVEEGSTLALIGPNGSGKSTLLLALSSIGRPAAGEVLFRGGEVASRKASLAYRRRIAMVFQEPLLLDATVAANVAFGLRMRGGTTRAEAGRRAGAAMERFRISHLAGRSSRNLSGGEAQRTSLARALAVSPEVLFLDEPFASLDPPTRESLIEDLAATLRETRTTTLIAIHHREEALRLTDRIAVMRDGRIVQEDSVIEVLNRPLDEWVASFVGVETIVEGRVGHREDGLICAELAGGAAMEAVSEAVPGETVLLCVRPEHVTVAPAAASPSSARNAYPATVARITPLGPYLKVALDAGFPLVAFITHQSADALDLREGARVTASLKATAVHVIRKGATLGGG